MLKKSLIIIILFSTIIISINDSEFAFAGVCTVDKDGDGHCLDPPIGVDPDIDDTNPCSPDPNTEACIGVQHVGGKIIPSDTTALLLAGTQSSLFWILPLMLGGMGLAVFRLKKDLF